MRFKPKSKTTRSNFFSINQNSSIRQQMKLRVLWLIICCLLNFLRSNIFLSYSSHTHGHNNENLTIVPIYKLEKNIFFFFYSRIVFCIYAHSGCSDMIALVFIYQLCLLVLFILAAASDFLYIFLL